MSKELCPHDLAKQLDLFDNSLSVCYDLNANSWQLGDVGVVSAYQILVINHVNSKCTGSFHFFGVRKMSIHAAHYTDFIDHMNADIHSQPVRMK